MSFPLQTLGKCAKMIPVMLWGTLIMRKRYGPKDYANAALITLGCTLFLMTGSVKVRPRRAGAGGQRTCAPCAVRGCCSGVAAAAAAASVLRCSASWPSAGMETRKSASCVVSVMLLGRAGGGRL